MNPNKDLCDAFAEAIRAWRDTSKRPEPKMVKCYTSDRVQMRHVLSLFRQGKILQSARAAYDMDTILRDLIPNGMWDIMCASDKTNL